MKTHKSFSNSFTKRVDHDSGRHRPSKAPSEPAVCRECGAIYASRRWYNPDSVTSTKHRFALPARETTCPACKQASDGEPQGFLYVDGEFVTTHREEVENLIRNEVERAGEDNPLARIIAFKEGDGHKLVVTTTTEHLVQRLGQALEKAFGGEVQYDFSHENKLARVNWER